MTGVAAVVCVVTVDALVRPDQVTLGVLVDSVPRDAVDDAVVACGVRERRSDGKLPAHVVTYLTLALSLFADDDYDELGPDLISARRDPASGTAFPAPACTPHARTSCTGACGAGSRTRSSYSRQAPGWVPTGARRDSASARPPPSRGGCGGGGTCTTA